MSEYYRQDKLVTGTLYNVGEHIVCTDEDTDMEHVVEITRRYMRELNIWTYDIKVVDDQYQTNNLGII